MSMKMVMTQGCSVDGCESPVATKKSGMCQKHRAEDYLNRIDWTCQLDGCHATGYARGYCRRHYSQAHLGLPFTFPVQKELGECGFEGCGRPAKIMKTQLCLGHHKQWQKGKPLVPLKRDGTLPDTRVCKECNEEKSIEDFYTRNLDKGHRNKSTKCKKCYIKDVREQQEIRKLRELGVAI